MYNFKIRSSMKKLLLSCLLSALCLTTAFAATYSGSCGENVYWSFDSSAKVLSIYGQGEMYDYSSNGTATNSPWWNYRDSIESINFASGVLTIGKLAFASCKNVLTVNFPDSLERIEKYAFSGCQKLSSVTIGDNVSFIGDCAFKNCNSLISLTCTATIPPTLESTSEPHISYHGEEYWQFISEIIKNLTINVPCASLESYRNAHWDELVTYKESYNHSYKSSREATLQGYGSCDEPPVPQVYTVIVSSANSAMGTVSGGGQYEEGTSVTITAIPKSGYIFAYWSDGTEQNPYTITVNSDINITAYFGTDDSNKYNVSVLPANSTMGRAFFHEVFSTEELNNGQYVLGTNLIAEAIPNSGYKFKAWNDGNNANPYGITVTRDISLLAIFEPVSSSTTYTVSVSSANSSMGTVSGGGTYEEGQTATVTATPKSGYKFTRWSNGSTANPYSFTVTSDVSLTAYFEQSTTPQSESKFWNISDAAFNSLGAITSQTTINGLTIHATANKPIVVDADAREINGYSFTHRLKFGGTGVNDARMLSFRVDGDCDIDIYLMSASGSADRTLNVDEGSFGNTIQQIPAYGSTISRGNVHYVGGATTIYLYSPSSGVNIYAIQVSYGSTPTPTEPIMVTCAEAAQIASSLSHNTQTSETYIVTGYITETDGVVSRGQQVFWMADTQNGGKVFESYWGNVTEKMLVGDKVSVEGMIMRYNSTYEIKNGNVTLIERDSPAQSFTVTVSSANSSMGTVSGGGTYEEGQTATVTATPKSGYKFTRWSNGSTANPYSFTVTSDVSLTAYFEQSTTPQSESKFWNISDAAFNSLGAITSQTTINGLTIHATANKPIVVDADAREINGYSFTHRLKFGGTGVNDARMLSFRVDGDCDIDIYLMSASGSADRTLNVDKGSFGNTIQQIPAYGSTISEGNVHYAGSATTIYLYSPSSGVNIYAIRVTYGGKEEGIDDLYVQPQEEASKILRNGQIYILRGDKTYTLQGQEAK